MIDDITARARAVLVDASVRVLAQACLATDDGEGVICDQCDQDQRDDYAREEADHG